VRNRGRAVSTQRKSPTYFGDHGAMDVLPSPAMNEELLTVAQAADVLKVSPLTVRRMVERGELKAIRLGGQANRQLRIDRAEIAERLRSWAEAVPA
jgi:excisionase family DNA binding protein